MSLCLMNVHGDIEGDYEFVCDIPKGTNGEVLQALFPNCVKSTDKEGWFITNIDGWTAFTPKWWKAPYQEGGE